MDKINKLMEESWLLNEKNKRLEDLNTEYEKMYYEQQSETEALEQ